MKRINQYFNGGCIAFTMANILVIIIHLINDQKTFNVKSEIFILLVILVLNTVLYLMENFQIKSQIIHMAFELFLTVIITFAFGISMRVMEAKSVYNVVEILFIIAITYGITNLSLYINSKNDANDINKKLSENK